ncbi:hypothetical protein T484DRAFT_2912721 [Baffinella frigidus]|nr:hypothetical protein T484DRAFT_2912721 [Cryptophyta sp. CCMP2293]
MHPNPHARRSARRTDVPRTRRPGAWCMVWCRGGRASENASSRGGGGGAATHDTSGPRVQVEASVEEVSGLGAERCPLSLFLSFSLPPPLLPPRAAGGLPGHPKVALQGLPHETSVMVAISRCAPGHLSDGSSCLPLPPWAAALAPPPGPSQCARLAPGFATACADAQLIPANFSAACGPLGAAFEALCNATATLHASATNATSNVSGASNPESICAALASAAPGWCQGMLAANASNATTANSTNSTNATEADNVALAGACAFLPATLPAWCNATLFNVSEGGEEDDACIFQLLFRTP